MRVRACVYAAIGCLSGQLIDPLHSPHFAALSDRCIAENVNAADEHGSSNVIFSSAGVVTISCSSQLMGGQGRCDDDTDFLVPVSTSASSSGLRSSFPANSVDVDSTVNTLNNADKSDDWCLPSDTDPCAPSHVKQSDHAVTLVNNTGFNLAVPVSVGPPLGSCFDVTDCFTVPAEAKLVDIVADPQFAFLPALAVPSPPVSSVVQPAGDKVSDSGRAFSSASDELEYIGQLNVVSDACEMTDAAAEVGAGGYLLLTDFKLPPNDRAAVTCASAVRRTVGITDDTDQSRREMRPQPSETSELENADGVRNVAYGSEASEILSTAVSLPLTKRKNRLKHVVLDEESMNHRKAVQQAKSRAPARATPTKATASSKTPQASPLTKSPSLKPASKAVVSPKAPIGPFKLSSGEAVSFSQVSGQWQASVKESYGPLSREMTLPVLCSGDLSAALRSLQGQEAVYRKGLIHILETAQVPWASRCIYIGELGLKGGGKPDYYVSVADNSDSDDNQVIHRQTTGGIDVTFRPASDGDWYVITSYHGSGRKIWVMSDCRLSLSANDIRASRWTLWYNRLFTEDHLEIVSTPSTISSYKSQRRDRRYERRQERVRREQRREQERLDAQRRASESRERERQEAIRKEEESVSKELKRIEEEEKAEEERLAKERAAEEDCAIDSERDRQHMSRAEASARANKGCWESLWSGVKAVGGAIGSTVCNVTKAVGSAAWEGVKMVGEVAWQKRRPERIKVFGGVYEASARANKGFWGSLWSGVKAVGGAIGSTVWNVTKAVGSAAWERVKTVGEVAWEVTKAVGKFLLKDKWKILRAAAVVAVGVALVVGATGGAGVLFSEALPYMLIGTHGGAAAAGAWCFTLGMSSIIHFLNDYFN